MQVRLEMLEDLGRTDSHVMRVPFVTFEGADLSIYPLSTTSSSPSLKEVGVDAIDADARLRNSKFILANDSLT